jgi:plastocyanin
VLAAISLPIVAAFSDRSSPSPVREIRLVAKDMAFYLEGQSAPNPTLRVRPGEHIRLILRNQTPGMSHDLVITTWQIRTPLLARRGDEAVVSFRVPDRAGSSTYHCSPHSEMMRGRIVVE